MKFNIHLVISTATLATLVAGMLWMIRFSVGVGGQLERLEQHYQSDWTRPCQAEWVSKTEWGTIHPANVWDIKKGN